MDQKPITGPIKYNKPQSYPTEPLLAHRQHGADTTKQHRFEKTPISHKTMDTIIEEAVQERTNMLPNTSTIKDEIGKSPKHKGLMWPRNHARTHSAAPLLDSYSTNGCPVDCGPDWTMTQINAALEYGAHPTAIDPVANQCLMDETKGKVDKGFARVIRWGDIKDNPPPKFKLSPVAMIPHKSRKFRCILDLSFALRNADNNHKSVNETTTKFAKEESMKELGSALKRIIAAVADGQRQNKKFVFSKLDIKDGFWRMIVSDEDAWNFCYSIPNLDPTADLDDTQIVVPNSLQMGWCESPPFFCAASETARDIIQSLLGTNLAPHPLEQKVLPQTYTEKSITDLTSNITLIEVFVDDFIACTDGLSKHHLLNTSRAMLHGIHSIFPPTNVTGHNGGDPISEKKLDQLEGLWEHVKEILGWIIDGANHTIYLPPKKVDKITATLKKLISKSTKSIPLKAFQKIAGTLHHAAMGMPGGRGLFTIIWTAMAKHNKGYIKMTANLKDVLRDFKWLFREIANKPVNVAQIVPDLPDYHGYSDACKSGAGGVWILPTTYGTPRFVFWNLDWPIEIITLFENSDLSINDLEMAGVLLEWLVLEHLVPSLEHTRAGIQCDNTSSVRWSTKFTARSIVAGHLLRALALRQQICRSAPLLVISIAGKLNDMADVASRYTSDTTMQNRSPTLLTYFNSNFPQTSSWEQFHLPRKLTSLVISSLQGKQLTLESWRRLPGLAKNTGGTGAVTQTESTSTRFSQTQTPSSVILPLPHSLLGSGQVTTERDIKSKFKESLKPSRPSARPLNWLD